MSSSNQGPIDAPPDAHTPIPSTIEAEAPPILEKGNTDTKIEDQFEDPAPARDVQVLEMWNHPKINIYRYFATLYCFIVMGMGDAAYGVGDMRRGAVDGTFANLNRL